MITEKGLKEIAGEGNVSEEPSILKAYSADQSFVGRVLPRYVAKVDSTEMVKRLVSAARETATPLVPVSSGAPHFNGDTVPSAGGAVIVDLSGMKGITFMDERDRVCVVEPGVTFGELIPAVAELGMRLNMPLAPRATKSVLGSMLSREAVIMPHYHWDISDPIGSVEVIFGTGDMFRTGAAAGPGNIKEQRAAGNVQKEAAGPSANSWHRLLQGAQGTMGIVTWASLRCELIPTVEEPYFVGSNSLSKLQEAIYWLVRLRLGNECLILSNVDVASLMAKDDSEYAKMVSKLPAWVLFFNLAAYDYLPEMRMEGQTHDMQELLQRIGLDTSHSVAGIGVGQFLETIRKPSDEPYWKLRQQGACQDIYFLTTPGKVPGLIKVMIDTAEAAGFSGTKIGTYVQPIVQGTNTHVEFSLFYDPEDKAEAAIVKGLATSAIEPLMGAGAFFSRPFGEAARMIVNRDSASVDTLKRVRSIVDPAGILNPGKLCF
jgi:FAD/FMN-containing dehydrogenase